jgi:hypothetical protein
MPRLRAALKVITICWACVGTGRDPRGGKCLRCGGSKKDPNP